MDDWKTRPRTYKLTIVKSVISPPKLIPPKEPVANVISPKKLSPIDRLRRTLSIRNRKKENTGPSSIKNGTKTKKPLQWQEDEKSVRVGTCSFNVKYLGSIEVQESRGMNVCEQAIQALLNQKNQHIKAVLHISGDALRVVDETNKGLIVDQTIEKVSFCAPDHHHGKGFAYISRNGATRRWICHGFLAIKDTGERLSHTVGCAFQICLERKQKHNRDCNVTAEYTENGTSFTRFGSFRPPSITERMIDPQSVLVAEPIPTISSNQKPDVNERPRPKGNNSDAFNRTTSMRSSDINQTTPNVFKRQSSLTLSDLPSIAEMKYKNSLTDTIPEEVEVISTTNEFPKLSLCDSTNINSHKHVSLPPSKSSTISLPSNVDNENILSNFWLTNSPSIISEQAKSINEAVNSNLTALGQSNHPINPFSPYAYSMAAQAQSPDTNFRQSSIFTPKRGKNPFDDDLIRR